MRMHTAALRRPAAGGRYSRRWVILEVVIGISHGEEVASSLKQGAAVAPLWEPPAARVATLGRIGNPADAHE